MGVFSGKASAHWEWLWEAVGCDLGVNGREKASGKGEVGRRETAKRGRGKST